VTNKYHDDDDGAAEIGPERSLGGKRINEFDEILSSTYEI